MIIIFTILPIDISEMVLVRSPRLFQGPVSYCIPSELSPQAHIYIYMEKLFTWKKLFMPISRSLVERGGRLEGPLPFGDHALLEHATGRGRLDPGGVLVLRRLVDLLLDLGID